MKSELCHVKINTAKVWVLKPFLMFLMSKFYLRYAIFVLLISSYKLYSCVKHGNVSLGVLIWLAVTLIGVPFVFAWIVVRDCNQRRVSEFAIDGDGISLLTNDKKDFLAWSFFNSYEETDKTFVYINSKGFKHVIDKWWLGSDQLDSIREISNEKINSSKSSDLPKLHIERKGIIVDLQSSFRDKEIAEKYKFFHSTGGMIYCLLLIAAMGLFFSLYLKKGTSISDIVFILMLAAPILGLGILAVYVKVKIKIDQIRNEKYDINCLSFSDDNVEFYNSDTNNVRSFIDWSYYTSFKETQRFVILYHNRKIAIIVNKNHFDEGDLDRFRSLEPILKLSNRKQNKMA